MEKSKLKQQNLVIAFIVCLLSLLLMHHPAWATVAGQADIIIDTEAGQPVYLTKGKLVKIKSPAMIKRAHIVDPKIAELIYSKTQSPRWVFISGKAVGSHPAHPLGK
jgi:pilus assembly protein CpaC